MGVKEKWEREKDGGEKEWDTDRQAGRQTDRQTERLRQTDGVAFRQSDCERQECLPRSTACKQMRSVNSLAKEDRMALRDISTAPVRTVLRHPRRPTTAFITNKPVNNESRSNQKIWCLEDQPQFSLTIPQANLELWNKNSVTRSNYDG